jgi:glucuronyl/N-acetylglucosaminyl transferase EXT2
MTVLPRSIFAMVSSSFNCEDMAMSLFISSLTQARPPLLADFWAIKSMIKLYSKKRISAQKNHKSLRDECVNSFAEQLQVKVGNTQLYAAPFLHQDAPLFDCGDERDPVQTPRIERLVALSNKIQRWKSQDIAVTAKELSALQAAISSQAYELGLIENSDRWRQRWKSGNRTKS